MSDDCISTDDLKRQKFVRRYKVITLPVRGQKIRIQSLSAGEGRRYKARLLTKTGEVNKHVHAYFNQLLIAQSAVDTNGNRHFTDEEVLAGGMDDMFDLADEAKLYYEVKDFTGINGDSDFAAIEDAIKNSESTPAN